MPEPVLIRLAQERYTYTVSDHNSCTANNNNYCDLYIHHQLLLLQQQNQSLATVAQRTITVTASGGVGPYGRYRNAYCGCRHLYPIQFLITIHARTTTITLRSLHRLNAGTISGRLTYADQVHLRSTLTETMGGGDWSTSSTHATVAVPERNGHKRRYSSNYLTISSLFFLALLLLLTRSQLIPCLHQVRSRRRQVCTGGTLP